MPELLIDGVGSARHHSMSEVALDSYKDVGGGRCCAVADKNLL
jgi:hypothetical protein